MFMFPEWEWEPYIRDAQLGRLRNITLSNIHRIKSNKTEDSLCNNKYDMI
jgi:hypothetical protein